MHDYMGAAALEIGEVVVPVARDDMPTLRVR